MIILVGPITGAALNPAREFGPDLIGSLIGTTGSAATKWDQLPVYIVGPIVGGILGAFLYEFIGHTAPTTVPGPATESAHIDSGRAEVAG